MVYVAVNKWVTDDQRRKFRCTTFGWNIVV